MSHTAIRAFNKHYFNRLVHRFAGVSRTPFALIRHVGRRSGKPYETPIIVMPQGNGFASLICLGKVFGSEQQFRIADRRIRRSQ